MENENKNEAMPQQHDVKLYILLPCGRRGYMFVDAAKCRAIRPFLPTREILETHFEMQYVLREKARMEEKSFRPMPLYLQLESAIFAEACEELAVGYGNVRREELRNAIALTLGDSYLPCCIMSPARSDTNKK